MSRFRLYPAAERFVGLDGHCGHARFVWNLAVEQQAWIAVSAALSTGELLHCPGLRPKEAERMVRLQRRLAARTIALGHRVTAWGGVGLPKPVNREPQLDASLLLGV